MSTYIYYQFTFHGDLLTLFIDKQKAVFFQTAPQEYNSFLYYTLNDISPILDIIISSTKILSKLQLILGSAVSSSILTILL